MEKIPHTPYVSVLLHLKFVVSVSVTVSAESIGQLEFRFRYWTETKIVVSVVHQRMPKGVTTWGFSLPKWLSTKGSHKSWPSGEWAVKHGFPFHIQQNQCRPYQHRDHSITCFIRKKITQAKPLALFLYCHNNRTTSDPLRISTYDYKIRGSQQFQL